MNSRGTTSPQLVANLGFVSSSSADEYSVSSATSSEASLTATNQRLISAPIKPQTSLIPTRFKNLKIPEKKKTTAKVKRTVSQKNRKRPITKGFVPSTRDVVISTEKCPTASIPAHVNTEFMVLIQKFLSNYISGNDEERLTLAGLVVQQVSKNFGRFLTVLPNGQWEAAEWEDSERYTLETFQQVIDKRNQRLNEANAGQSRPPALLQVNTGHPLVIEPVTPEMYRIARIRYDELIRHELLMQKFRQANSQRRQVQKPLKSILRNHGTGTSIAARTKQHRPAVGIQSTPVVVSPSGTLECNNNRPSNDALSMLSSVAVALDSAERQRPARQL